jgi:hypothetical protein
MTRKIEVQVVGDSRSLERAFGRAGHAGKGLGTDLQRLGRSAKFAIGGGIGAGLVGLGVAAHASFKEFTQAQRATAQTAAVLKSTGGAANVTAKHITDLSNALLKKTGIDDEVIQSGENMLLTFRGIRNEVGKGNDIFDQATKAALDMSTAMEGAGFEGGNLKTTAIRLGKALNDPVTGMTALRRVGVTFTKSQQDMIKHLEATGHHLEAQKLILRELNKEFGGSAEAAGKTLPGQLTILREQLKNVGADVVGFVVPSLESAMTALGDIAGWIGQIAHAPSLKIALDIAGSGIKDIGSRIKSQIQSAISSVDWAPIGRQLGQALGSGIVFTNEAMNRALGQLLGFMNAHAQDFANLGAELALRMASTLMDPNFYAHHWRLTLGIAAVVLGRGMFRVGGEAAGAFVTAFFSGRIATIGRVLLSQFERLPGPVQSIARFVGRGLYAGISESVGLLRRLLGKIPGWISAAFKVGAVVAFIGELKNIYEWLRKLVARVWKPVISVEVHLPGGKAGKVLDKLIGGAQNLGAGLTGGVIPNRQARGGFVPRIPGSIPGVDSVPSLLMPGEIVVNPRDPMRGLQALRAAGFEQFAKGGAVKKPPKHHDSKAKQHADIQKAKQKVAAGIHWGELKPALELAIFNAEQTEGTGDDITAHQAALDYFKWQLRQVRKFKLGPAAELAVRRAMKDQEDALKELQGGSGSAAEDDSGDLRAQLEQARAQLGAAQNEAALANAFVATGIFGGGGGGGGGGQAPQIVLQSLVMPSHEMIRHAAKTVAHGFGIDGYRRAKRYRLGV